MIPGLFAYLNLNVMNLENYKFELHHKIKEISFSGRMNSWEKEYLKNISKQSSLSPKQKNLIDRMFDKYVLQYDSGRRE